MKTISLKLSEALIEQLNNEAEARRITVSELIRESIMRNLREPEAPGPSCFDLVRDLAGSIKGLPKDLATNPRYMDGFGR
jgi:hypothetical protein